MKNFNLLNLLILFFSFNITRPDFFNDDFENIFNDMHKEINKMNEQMNKNLSSAQSINYNISNNKSNNINYSYEKNENGYLITLNLPEDLTKENIKAKYDKKNKKVTVYIKSDNLTGQIDINDMYCSFKINMSTSTIKEDKNNKENSNSYKSFSSSSQSQTFSFDLKIDLSTVKPVFDKKSNKLLIQLDTIEKHNDIEDLYIDDL